MVPANGEGPSLPYADGPGDQAQARFSPDGRWVAFASSELGSMEVFVAPLADGTAKQRVSVAGGRHPAWSRDGAELHYVNDDTVYTATFSPQTREIATQRALFSLGEPFVVAGLDPAPDGEHFLVAARDQRRSGSSITILLNWQGAIGNSRLARRLRSRKGRRPPARYRRSNRYGKGSTLIRFDLTVPVSETRSTPLGSNTST